MGSLSVGTIVHPGDWMAARSRRCAKTTGQCEDPLGMPTLLDRWCVWSSCMAEVEDTERSRNQRKLVVTSRKPNEVKDRKGKSTRAFFSPRPISDI